MAKMIGRKIKPFNEFWINCESTILNSLLITIDECYRVLAYNNYYTYQIVPFRSPNGKWVNEVRIRVEISGLFEKVLKNGKGIKWSNCDEALQDIVSFLKQGKIVLLGVDLYYWIPFNMCYHKHHVEHYSLVNGFDEERNVFFVMDTDNVEYREFEITVDNIIEANANCELPFDAFVYDLCDCEELDSYMFDRKELLWRARRIVRSLRPLRKKYFWLMTNEDYKICFNRDMCVMYILQINCRMKANRLLLEHLINEKGIGKLWYAREECYRIEMNWVNIRNNVSKVYYTNDSVSEMKKLGDFMKIQFADELNMWREFIKILKKHKNAF